MNEGNSLKILKEATLAEVIAVDRKLNKIIPWINLKKAIDNLDIDGLSFHSGLPQKSEIKSSESSLIILLAIFILLLLLVFVIFGILVCYYRRKFEQEKDELVRAKIISAAKQSNQRQWSVYLERPPELLW